MPKKEKLNDVESESIIISSILVDDLGYDEAFNLLEVDDFTEPKYKTVFEAFVRLRNNDNNAPITPHSTYVQLSRMYLDNGNIASSLIGLDELSDLTNNVLGLSSLRSAIEIVRDLSIKRSISQAGQQIDEISTQADKDSEESLAKADILLQKIRLRKGYSSFVSVTEALEQLEKRLTEAKGSKVLKSGFRDLDRYIGFHNSEVTIIAARPGVGKTAFALNIAQNVVVSGKNVAFFSLEMSTDELAQRYASMNSNISSLNMRENQLAPADKEQFSKVISDSQKYKLFIDSTPGLTLNDIISRAKIKHNDIVKKNPKERLDLIVIDYLQLIKADREVNKNAPRHEQVANISRNLKRAAKEMNIPIIACAQLNRGAAVSAVMGKNRKSEPEPFLANLGESSAIEQDADIVLMMYLQDPDKDEEDDNIQPKEEVNEDKKLSSPKVVAVKIEKNRHGLAGETLLYHFQGNRYKFIFLKVQDRDKK